MSLLGQEQPSSSQRRKMPSFLKPHRQVQLLQLRLVYHKSCSRYHYHEKYHPAENLTSFCIPDYRVCCRSAYQKSSCNCCYYADSKRAYHVWDAVKSCKAYRSKLL